MGNDVLTYSRHVDFASPHTAEVHLNTELPFTVQ
jgi:hypothetical protein